MIEAFTREAELKWVLLKFAQNLLRHPVTGCGNWTESQNKKHCVVRYCVVLQVNYFVPTVLCFLIFVAFGEDAFVSAENAPCLIVLLVLYG